MSKNKFISQQERMANLHPNLKEKIEELNKESYHEEEYQYYSEKDGRPLIDWEEYEKTLDKANLTELIIRPNIFNFKDKKLVIKDYPKLKTLYACGLDLKKAELDCPSLENLYLTNNQLKRISLTKVSNLVNLSVNNNFLTSIRVKNVKKLQELSVDLNNLKILDVRGLKHLRYLDCSHNAFFVFFPFSSTDNRGLRLKNNPSLQILDAAGCHLPKRFKFPYLPNLEMISLRNASRNDEEGGVNRVLNLKCPNLKFLDYLGSCIKEVVFDSEYPLKNPDQLRICDAETYRNPDGSYNPDVPTEWEDRVYRMHQQREKEWINGDWGFAFEDNPKKNIYYEKPEDKQKTDDEKEEAPPITDPAQLTSDYKEHPKKNTLAHLTITHFGLTGTMIIDGYSELEDLNIGNNYLSYLVVSNCPKLKNLRYAHNKLKHDAFIINCPQLTTINKENCNGGIVWDEKSEEQFSKGELKGEDALNEKYEQLNEKPKEEQKEESTKQQEPTEEQKILVKLAVLLVNTEQFLKNNDLKEAGKTLEQIKQYANNEVYKNNKTLIENVSNLEKELKLRELSLKEQKQSQQPPAPHQQNEYNKQTFPYWLIVVIYGIFLWYLFTVLNLALFKD